MRADGALEEEARLPAKAVVAGLAVLCAAALAALALDGVPAARRRGQAAPAAAAGPAAAPVPRMRFHGPGDELFDFTPAEHRFPAGADAGLRRGAPQ